MKKLNKTNPSSTLIAIVAAMAEELAPLLKRVEQGQRRVVEGRWVVTGTLDGKSVVVTATGIGPRKAKRGCRLVLDHFPVTHLLGLGVAGGVDPSLAVGDILVAREVQDDQGQRAPSPDPGWLDAALCLGRVQAGTLITVPRVVTHHAGKMKLWRTLPGDQPAALDMETVVFAHQAAQAGVPYLVLRAVSDTAEEDLPAFLIHAQRPDGRINRAGIVRGLFRHPLGLFALVKMRRRVHNCAERLADLAVQLLEEQP